MFSFRYSSIKLDDDQHDRIIKAMFKLSRNTSIRALEAYSRYTEQYMAVSPCSPLLTQIEFGRKLSELFPSLIKKRHSFNGVRWYPFVFARVRLRIQCAQSLLYKMFECTTQ